MSTPTSHTAEACSATVRTDHGTPTRADRVARAVAPDNTASMTTRAEGSTVTTEIDRDTTGGLQSTVDDYVVNLGVADAVLDAVGDGVDADAAVADVDADATGAGTSDSNSTGESTAAETTTDDTTQT